MLLAVTLCACNLGFSQASARVWTEAEASVAGPYQGTTSVVP
jgi:hypothetical protein